MILLEKRAHLILKTPFPMVHRLRVDVFRQRANVRRTDGKQTITALPRKVSHPLLFPPRGRYCLDLRNEFCGCSCRCQSHRKMNVVGNPTRAETFAIQLARCPRDIRMKCRADIIVDKRSPMFRAENNMHQVEAQRLRHARDYMPGLQPLPASPIAYLGLRPRLVCWRAFSPQDHHATAMSQAPQTRGGMLRASINAYPGLRPRLVCWRTFGPQDRRASAMRNPSQPCNDLPTPIRQAPTARRHHGLGLPPPIRRAPKARQHTSLGRRPRRTGVRDEQG